MNIVLWILQVLLAAGFFAHGLLFLSPPAAMVEQMNAALPRWFQLFLGVAEVLAAVGLILPGLTRIMPWLVTWAAIGIMVVMVSATAFHLMRGENSSAGITLVLLVVAAFLAYMRHRVLPIRPRSVVGSQPANGATRFPLAATRATRCPRWPRSESALAARSPERGRRPRDGAVAGAGDPRRSCSASRSTRRAP